MDLARLLALVLARLRVNFKNLYRRILFLLHYGAMLAMYYCCDFTDYAVSAFNSCLLFSLVALDLYCYCIAVVTMVFIVLLTYVSSGFFIVLDIALHVVFLFLWFIFLLLVEILCVSIRLTCFFRVGVVLKFLCHAVFICYYILSEVYIFSGEKLSLFILRVRQLLKILRQLLRLLYFVVLMQTARIHLRVVRQTIRYINFLRSVSWPPFIDYFRLLSLVAVGIYLVSNFLIQLWSSCKFRYITTVPHFFHFLYFLISVCYNVKLLLFFMFQVKLTFIRLVLSHLNVLRFLRNVRLFHVIRFLITCCFFFPDVVVRILPRLSYYFVCRFFRFALKLFGFFGRRDRAR